MLRISCRSQRKFVAVFCCRHGVLVISGVRNQGARRKQVQLWKSGLAGHVQCCESCDARDGSARLRPLWMPAHRLSIAVRPGDHSPHLRLSLQRVFEDVQRQRPVVGVHEGCHEELHHPWRSCHRALRRAGRRRAESCWTAPTEVMVHGRRHL